MRTRLPILLFAVVAFFQASALSAQSTPLPRTYAFGTSCGGATPGSAQISIDPTTVADLGDTLRVWLTGAQPNIAVALNTDRKFKAFNSTPTPLKRYKLASQSCTAQVSPYTTNQGVSYWTVTNANGEAYIDLKIPDSTSYNGTRFNMEWMMSSYGGRTQAMTVSGAISTMMREEISLRNVIGATNASTNGRVSTGIWNTVPAGVSYTAITIPVVAQERVRLKRLRIIGSNGSTGVPAPGSMDFHVWSSLSAAIASYSSGNVFNGWVAPSATSTPFGTGAFNAPTVERIYNVLDGLSGFAIQPNVQYRIGFSVETAGYTTFRISDTLAPSCAADTLVGSSLPSGWLFQGPTVSSGCAAADIVATAY
jgi:hypothetical protein